MTFYGDPPGQCWLCGLKRPTRMALLRVAFSNSTTQVMACAGCARTAWQTVEELQFELAARRAPAKCEMMGAGA